LERLLGRKFWVSVVTLYLSATAFFGEHLAKAAFGWLSSLTLVKHFF
jgi:hypothetical protein